MKLLTTGLLIATCLVGPACAQDVPGLVRQSHALASQQRHGEAIQLLLEHESAHPDDLILKLAIARLLAWSGQYDAAEQRLLRMTPAQRANADVMLLEADLSYYRGRPLEAIKTYQAILEKAPNYQDARDGLERVRAAVLAAASITPTAPTLANWQVASGAEYSGFNKEGRAPWRQYFLQIDHLREGTSPYARVTHYDQYNLVDTEYELGANWVAPARWSVNAGAACVQQAQFKPTHRLYINAEYALINGEGATSSWWGTMQVRQDAYADGARVDTVNPGLAWVASPMVKLSSNLIAVDKTDAPRLYGRAMRVDITASDKLAWHVGYADAPETELTQVVRTRTWFTGLTLSVGDGYTVRLGYARDDRANAYIREVINASVAHRF
ncbi:MAG: tetratricopeptide repeat protein [Aquabacterium sp.]|nr:tetratricopeptide repeat protein [Aquabacterium sp.]